MNINTAFPSKWLKAADIEDEDLILTISNVTIEQIGQGSNTEERPVIYFEETDKGLVLNKTNANTISKLYGGETNDWTGKRIALFATEVDFQGNATLALRVRLRPPAMKKNTPAQPDEGDIEEPFGVCAQCGTDLTQAQYAVSNRKYGRSLCPLHQIDAAKSVTV